MDATTERLVDYALGVNYEDIAPEIVAGTKTRLLDTLGCIAGAWEHPVSTDARQLAARTSMDTPATVIADGNQVAPEMAAFANSVMLRVLDVSDAYRVKCGGHPSDIMGAVFAAAELGARDGKSLIVGLALAYEVYCSFTESHDANSLGWDQPVYGVVASALGAGKLLGLDREQLGHTVALSLVPNMAMYQTRQGELSAWKGCAGGNAARNGLFAALLAQEGFTGPEQPIDGKFGFKEFVGEFDWALEPGKPPYRIGKTYLKAFPICYQGQTAVWAALEMRDQIAVADIEKVHIDTYLKSFTMMGSDPSRWAPKTRETADHSMPYVIAKALLDGGVTEASFSDDALRDPATLALMQKITVAADDAMTEVHPGKVPGRITVTLKDGKEVTHELPFPKGHSQSPMSDDEVKTKFRELYSVYGAPAGAEAVIDVVENLDALDDIEALFEAFRSGAEPAAVAV